MIPKDPQDCPYAIPEKNRARRHFVHDVLDVTLHDLAFRFLPRVLGTLISSLSSQGCHLPRYLAGLPGITKRFNDRSNLTTGIPSGILTDLWTMAPFIDDLCMKTSDLPYSYAQLPEGTHS